MANHDIMSISAAELQARYDQWSELDKGRNEFIQTLLRKLAYNEVEINRLQLEFEDQKTSRMQYQSEVARLRRELYDNESRINRDAYIAMLVDGDGAKFRDSLLQDPMSGAVEAAQNIKQQVRGHLKGTPLDTEDIPIVARVFANIKGLGNALQQSRVVASSDDVYTFAEHFTNSRADFEFVNVGRGKENADSKIRRMLSYFYKDPRCKRIFFVACHDGGYAHDLREYMGPPGIETRIVLVETTPAEPSLRSLGFPIIRFDNVFRDEPLQNESKLAMRNRPVANTSGQSIASGHSVAQEQRITPAKSTTPAQSTTPGTTSARSISPSIAPAESIITTSNNGGVSTEHSPSYSTAGGVSGHQNITVKPAKPSRQPRVIDYNAEGQRLDPPVKFPANKSAQESYRRKCERIKPRVFCNSFYLGGSCSRRDTCDKEHELALTADEVAVHRYMARTSMCYRGPECDNYHCHLSHHCNQGLSCTRPSCRFAKTKFGDLHLSKKEMEPATRWTEGCDFPVDLYNT
ncbi:Uncharacterized protein TPAR_05440 [Tolypocladium paradoxum]|uniref:C3H1-type domain-containing protein n=1 Tax=Tolypocladium paradoxum TaxID=94208 RepID=A0A2S4KW04_9HYPO|nr:Uncharacterized protein TPAR_05440 [Tolypocladium paradoxum]